MFIVDPPGPFSPIDQWQKFLEEMRAAHDDVRTIDDAMDIRYYIKMAEQRLKELGEPEREA